LSETLRTQLLYWGADGEYFLVFDMEIGEVVKKQGSVEPCTGGSLTIDHLHREQGQGDILKHGRWLGPGNISVSPLICQVLPKFYSGIKLRDLNRQ
jgi:hypothetical protein